MATEEESLNPSRHARALARGGAAVLGAGLLVSLVTFATAASGEEAPPTVTVTAGSASLTYGDAAPAYSFTAEGFLDADGWITEPICTSDYAAGTSVAASPVAVTCSGGDAGPGYLVDYVDGAVTIAPTSLAVTAGDASVTYGDVAPTYGFAAQGFLDGDGWASEPICTSAYEAGTSVADAPLAVACSGGDAGPDYDVTYTDGSLAIAPAELTVTADDASVTYGDAAPAYSFSVDGFLDGDAWTTEPSCTSTYASGTSAADAPLAITCSGGDAGPDYDVAYADGTLAIAAGAITVTADDLSVTYGDAAPAYPFSVEGFLDGDGWVTEPTCTSAYVAGTPVADSPLAITCSGGDAGPDYLAPTYVAGAIAIAPATVPTTPTDVSRKSGDPVPT
ncbi:MAG: MBG domain-containing protein, partial [Actinomycetota bacterium]